ncbi:MAG: glycosyltransferase family 39 protein, partial [Solirubrobacteraceae bacterium]
MPLLLITLLGAALRFYGLGHQGFWYDEAYTVRLMKLPFGQMLGALGHQESTPPLYYCLAWLWTRAFGPGQAGLRSLSATCGTAVIPVAYLTARRCLHDRRAALIVAALTAFNPLLIWYSQEARAYQLLVLVSACSLLAFAHARERPRAWPLALWTLTAVASL